MPIAYDPTNDALLRPELRDTVFSGHTQAGHIAVAVEAARLAYYRFEESDAEKARLSQALALAGYVGLQTFNSNTLTGTEAFGAIHASDGTALLAFRGTQPDKLADLGTDANALLVPWELGTGKAHFGFQRAYQAIRADIDQWRAGPAAGKQLIMSGHSLGAALACLCASISAPHRLVTVGGPRTGDSTFVASITGPWTRLVDCCDFVTRVPPTFLGYAHPDFRSYITWDGQIRENPTDDFIATDREQGRLDYLKHHAWRRGTVVVRDLADHAPINYARAFF
ncbi:lipase family protein [Polaromonas sp.]|uniref:lipase family protein n=1 Tax=Polaromonas sp. TaxID=1869339 RepID=UPI003753E1D8